MARPGRGWGQTLPTNDVIKSIRVKIKTQKNTQKREKNLQP